MPIKVNVSLSAGGQLKPVASRTLDATHITIGRDKECSLTLEDTQKHVSRVHADLDLEAGTYFMTVVSKVNPVLVNGKRHMYGDRVALADGDMLTIGLYKLEVVMPPAKVAAPPPPPPADVAEDMTYIPPAPAEQPAEPPSRARDDFSEDMTYVPPGRSPAPAQRPVDALADAELDTTYIPPSPIPPSPPAITPDEEITYVRPASELTNPLGRGMGPDGIEEDFSEDATYVRRPLPAAPTPKREPEPKPDSKPVAKLDIELDIELDFELPEDADLSEERTLYRPVATDASREEPAEELTQVRPSTHVPARAAAAGSPAAGPGAERALRAFLEGAGLRNLEIADPEAYLRDSGATVRAAIEGVMMLLLASTAVKKSLGADVDASEENPLNAMSDPARVIAFLFDPAKRVADGPDPVQALGDACSDLRVHQIALMACIQAAVLGALQRVDPRAIEREHGDKLGGLNITRKPKLWDLSVAHHEKVTLEIGESINRAFGPEVQAAYLAEVRRIRGGR